MSTNSISLHNLSNSLKKTIIRPETFPEGRGEGGGFDLERFENLVFVSYCFLYYFLILCGLYKDMIVVDTMNVNISKVL